MPRWSIPELSATGVLAAVAGLAVSVPLSFNVSCQVHEVGHALTGTALGWRVERVNLCLPANGAVDYAATPGASWVNTAESFAGGIAAALFLIAGYILVFAVPKTPLRGPGWWAAGFGPMLLIGPQVVVGVAEGANPHRNYGDVLEANAALTLSIVAATMAAGAAIHVRLWPEVWRRQAGP